MSNAPRANVLRKSLAAFGLMPAAKLLHRWLTHLGVPRVVPIVRRTLPHDPTAFTQGLAYFGRRLYESTGTNANSSLRCIDPNDGRLLQVVPVSGDFCEGIAQLNGRLYQLSWQSGTARVYELPGITMIGVAAYAGEGWGLTSRNDLLLMSDGSSVLRFVDETFNTLRTLRVTSHGIPIPGINDIEAGARSLLANVYGRTDILEVDPRTGRVLRIIDCSRLAAAAPPHNAAAVMNGIAYHPSNDSYFVTGKYWNSIFEITLP
jgi:glutamine cyclotransferase